MLFLHQTEIFEVVQGPGARTILAGPLIAAWLRLLPGVLQIQEL